MIQPEELSDIELLRKVADGDEVAFRAIYRRCQGPIYRFALHMSGSPSIAEDITQEVFVFLIEESSRFDPSRGTLTGYLFGIGRNLLLRRMAKERPFVSLDSDVSNRSGTGAANGSNYGSGHTSDHGSGNGHSNGAGSIRNGNAGNLTSPPAEMVRSEAIDRVRQAVLSLPPNYRESIVLCDLQELSYEEAAKVLDCAVGTVRSRLHRARALLADKLREFHAPQHKSVAGGRPKR